MKHFLTQIQNNRTLLHLEDGIGHYESFVVPKGMPKLNEGQRLAIRIKDHIEGDFTEDVIDEGEYILISETPTRRLFNLQGNDVRGNHIMMHIHGKEWLIRRQP